MSIKGALNNTWQSTSLFTPRTSDKAVTSLSGHEQPEQRVLGSEKQRPKDFSFILVICLLQASKPSDCPASLSSLVPRVQGKTEKSVRHKARDEKENGLWTVVWIFMQKPPLCFRLLIPHRQRRGAYWSVLKGDGSFITLTPHLRRLWRGSFRSAAPSPGYRPEIRMAITYPT